MNLAQINVFDFFDWWSVPVLVVVLWVAEVARGLFIVLRAY